MRQITPDDAMELDVPLSWGMEHDGWIYVSGQAAFDFDTGEIVGDGIREQTRRTLENVETVLEAEGASLDDVIKTTVYLTDVEDFEGMNDVYRETLTEPYPTRTALEVSDLAADIVVEIDAVAVVE
jgi:2-iminobutanoate/2-iminopropanoate deaminase